MKRGHFGKTSRASLLFDEAFQSDDSPELRFKKWRHLCDLADSKDSHESAETVHDQDSCDDWGQHWQPSGKESDCVLVDQIYAEEKASPFLTDRSSVEMKNSWESFSENVSRSSKRTTFLPSITKSSISSIAELESKQNANMLLVDDFQDKQEACATLMATPTHNEKLSSLNSISISSLIHTQTDLATAISTPNHTASLDKLVDQTSNSFLSVNSANGGPGVGSIPDSRSQVIDEPGANGSNDPISFNVPLIQTSISSDEFSNEVAVKRSCKSAKSNVVPRKSIRKFAFARQTIAVPAASFTVKKLGGAKTLHITGRQGQACAYEYKLCREENLRDFDSVLKSLEGSVEKIGEGAFSEVFKVVLQPHSDAVFDLEKRVLKVIALTDSVNRQNVDNEYEISDTLGKLCQNFVQLHEAWYVVGKYPTELLDAWSRYQTLYPYLALNSYPGLFPQDSHFCVLVMEDAGTPFENFTFKKFDHAVSIIQQIACSLAVAEEQLEFEHRDLHMSNVLISTTREKRFSYRINNNNNKDIISLSSRGVKATIIDYSLSRLRVNNQLMFKDLSREKDADLFEKQENSDEESEKQFEVYREMKALLNNNWTLFVPETNLCWFYHITDRLLYWKKKTDFETYDPEKRDKLKRVYLKISAGEYSSCVDLVLNSNLLKI